MRPPPVGAPPVGPPPVRARSAPDGTGRRLLGLALLLPAAGVGITELVVPALRTAWASLHQVDPLGSGSASFTGLGNYARIGGLGPWLFAVGLGVLLFLAGTLLGLLLGRLLAAASEPWAWLVRGLQGLTLALYAPVGVALGLRSDLGRSPDRLGLVTAALVAWLPLVVVLVALVSSMLLSPVRSRDGRRAAAVLTVVGLLAAVGLAVQTLDLPLVLTDGGPDGRTTTPGLVLFHRAAEFLDLGGGAAAALVILLVAGVLGLAATALLVAADVRLDFRTDPGPRTSGTTWVASLVAAAGSLLLLAGYLWAAHAWVVGLLSPQAPVVGQVHALRVAFITYALPLITVSVQVGTALLAGFGLGWLRPLGRHSEWLLLVYSPGLFVGLVPLLPVHLLSLFSSHDTSTLLRLVPPLSVSVPMTVLFTLAFAGLRRAWFQRQGRGRMLLTLLCLVVFVAALAELLWASAAGWSFASSTDVRNLSGPALLATISGQLAMGPLPQRLATPLPVLAVFCVVFAVAAAVGFHRLTLRCGGPAQQDAQTSIGRAVGAIGRGSFVAPER